MPFKFTVTPTSQVQQKASPAKSSTPRATAKSGSPATQKRRTTVTVASYGGKLFEPVMAREKPIAVHFLEHIMQDGESIIRFSDDGFFAVKYFLLERRCYLIYFINPINPTPQTTLDSAIAEAIDFKTYEFEDELEYIQATQRKDKDGLISNIEAALRLREKSALGKLENKVREILRDKINAEKFLKRKREFEKQDKDWEIELAKQEQEALEEETTLVVEKEVKPPLAIPEEMLTVPGIEERKVVEEIKPVKKVAASFWGKKL